MCHDRTVALRILALRILDGCCNTVSLMRTKVIRGPKIGRHKYVTNLTSWIEKMELAVANYIQPKGVHNMYYKN